MSMNFVLVPGAGGDGHYWDLVAPLLRGAGHRVIAPDLPGPDDAAGLGEYADAIVAAAGDVGAIVLVAQSMGAFSAPMAAERLDVERMILVAPMIPAPGDTPGTWWSSTGQDVAAREAAIAEGRDPDAPFDLHETFLHDVPEPVVEDLLARGERPESGRAFGDTWPLAALAGPADARRSPAVTTACSRCPSCRRCRGTAWASSPRSWTAATCRRSACRARWPSGSRLPDDLAVAAARAVAARR